MARLPVGTAVAYPETVRTGIRSLRGLGYGERAFGQHSRIIQLDRTVIHDGKHPSRRRWSHLEMLLIGVPAAVLAIGDTSRNGNLWVFLNLWAGQWLGRNKAFYGPLF